MTHSNPLSYFRKQHMEFFTISKPKSFSLDGLNRTHIHNIQLFELVTSALLNERYKKIWDQM